MPTKKATTKSKATKTPKEAKAKKCECDKCDCECSVKCAGINSQISFYVLIALLVATMTVLVISLSFNKSVRDIFRPSTYAYNGRFDSESTGKTKDENNFPILSAGATVDMFATDKTGFLIVSDEDSKDSDAFARRVANLSDGTVSVYRYNISTEKSIDDERALAYIGSDETPSFIYVRNGAVFDRLDAPKEEEDLKLFLEKYSSISE